MSKENDAERLKGDEKHPRDQREESLTSLDHIKVNHWIVSVPDFPLPGIASTRWRGHLMLATLSLLTTATSLHPGRLGMLGICFFASPTTHGDFCFVFCEVREDLSRKLAWKLRYEVQGCCPGRDDDGHVAKADPEGNRGSFLQGPDHFSICPSRTVTVK